MYIPNPAALFDKQEAPTEEKKKPKRKIVIKDDMDMKDEPTPEMKKEIIKRRFQKYGG